MTRRDATPLEMMCALDGFRLFRPRPHNPRTTTDDGAVVPSSPSVTTTAETQAKLPSFGNTKGGKLSLSFCNSLNQKTTAGFRRTSSTNSNKPTLNWKRSWQTYGVRVKPIGMPCGNINKLFRRNQDPEKLGRCWLGTRSCTSSVWRPPLVPVRFKSTSGAGQRFPQR